MAASKINRGRGRDEGMVAPVEQRVKAPAASAEAATVIDVAPVISRNDRFLRCIEIR
jgi:hypothetical protein